MLFGKLRSKIKYAVLAAVAVVGLSAAASPASAQWGNGYGGYGGYGGNGGYGNYGGYGGYNRGSSMHYDRQFHGNSHWTPWRGYHSHGHYDYVPHYTPRNSHGGHHH